MGHTDTYLIHEDLHEETDFFFFFFLGCLGRGKP